MVWQVVWFVRGSVRWFDWRRTRWFHWRHCIPRWSEEDATQWPTWLVWPTYDTW